VSSGAKVDKPFILPKYFPLAVDKYITVHFNSKPAKTYDFGQDVIDIIGTPLGRAGIQVVQLGDKSSRFLKRAYITNGQTNINQVAYILQNTLLHCGVDSFPIHFAGAYDKKVVGLYSNSHVNNVRPFWGNSANHVLLEPARNGTKPSHAFDEVPKTINTIPPELIASSVLQLLGIDYHYPYKTLCWGDAYLNFVLEAVPNQVVDISSIGIQSLIMRMDYLFNENNLAGQLSKNNCSIVTDRPLHLDILRSFKNNISHIVYQLDDNHNPEFVAKMQELGVKFTLFSCADDKTLEKYKMYYMDYGIIFKKRFPTEEEINQYRQKGSLFYKTGKLILSNGKIFPSRAAMEADLSVPSFDIVDPLPILDTPAFWREFEYFYLLTSAQAPSIINR
jgi:hypothetical protein